MNKHGGMRPQDVVVLLKIVALGEEPWLARDAASALHLSPAEVSNSLKRSALADLYDPVRKQVAKRNLLDLLVHGLRYVFPAQPGGVGRGVPTAHSAPPLDAQFRSGEGFVWPSAKGSVQGQAIEPLYPGVPDVALEDPAMHQLLALVDALRVGRTRERTEAAKELTKRLK